MRACILTKAVAPGAWDCRVGIVVGGSAVSQLWERWKSRQNFSDAVMRMLLMPSVLAAADHASMDTHTIPRPGSRSLRKRRVSISGQIYLITTICHQRRRHFAAWETAQLASVALTERRLWRGSHLLCWVLMPDHLHLLVELADTEPLSRLMQRVKAITARALNQLADQGAAVWTPGYHDRALRVEEDVVEVSRYIVANPLRAGLVDDIGLYPYWDAIWFDGMGDSL